MQFENSETFYNLARAFAGESQAGMRYQMVAKQAMAEGLVTLADTIRTIAKNETYHATQFFKRFIELGGSKENVKLDAEYPFHTGTLAESLQFALNDEKQEQSEIYPTFAKIAEKEGFQGVAVLYRLVAQVERTHEHLFRYLRDAVKDGTLYKSEKPVAWVCGDCGHTHVSTEAFEVCPLCGAPQGHVLLHLPNEGSAL